MRGRWRDFKLARSGYYTAEGLRVIALYNAICTPHGFLRVDGFSESLHDALEVFTEGGLNAEMMDIFRAMFEEAVELRESGENYKTPKGAKLIRILWNNY
jgi:hypothetical protein